MISAKATILLPNLHVPTFYGNQFIDRETVASNMWVSVASVPVRA